MSPYQKNKKYILEKVAEGRVLTDKKQPEVWKEKLDATERKEKTKQREKARKEKHLLKEKSVFQITAGKKNSRKKLSRKENDLTQENVSKRNELQVWNLAKIKKKNKQ